MVPERSASYIIPLVRPGAGIVIVEGLCGRFYYLAVSKSPVLARAPNSAASGQPVSWRRS